MQEELQRFKDNDVFDVVEQKNVPPGVKLFTTTWEMKRKSNGLEQAARILWNQLLKTMRQMGFAKSTSDPCNYYKWTNNGLLVWIS